MYVLLGIEQTIGITERNDGSSIVGIEFLLPLEQEDESMDWDTGKLRVGVGELVSGPYFFELNVGTPQIVDELGEDSWVGFDGAPRHVESGCPGWLFFFQT